MKNKLDPTSDSIHGQYGQSFTYTPPIAGVYSIQREATLENGDTIIMGAFVAGTERIERIKPKWWQFWKPVIEKHYIYFKRDLK